MMLAIIQGAPVRNEIIYLVLLFSILLLVQSANAQEENRAYYEDWYDVVYQHADGGRLVYTEWDGKQYTLAVEEMTDQERKVLELQLPFRLDESTTLPVRYRQFKYAEYEVAKALQSKIEGIDISEMTIVDLIYKLEDPRRIRIIIDWKAAGLKEAIEDIPVTISLEGMTISEALRKLLRPRGLQAVYYYEALLVTTKKEAKRIENMLLKPPQRIQPPKSYKEKWLRTALCQSPSRICFIDMPLWQVVDHLSESHGIKIELDNDSLRRSGIPNNLNVTVDLEELSLAAALTHMLRPMYLTWRVEKGGIQIIRTKEKIPAHVEFTQALPTDVCDPFHNPMRTSIYSSGTTHDNDLPEVCKGKNPFGSTDSCDPFGTGNDNDNNPFGAAEADATKDD